jgi:hypothetical protein
MKTERRHELKHNELADALGSEIDYLRPYYKTIVGALIAVAVVGVTIAILANQRSANNAAAWGSFYDVVADGNSEKMPAKLDSLAKAYSGTAAGAWAELAAGDLELQSGAAKMFTDRDDAKKALTKAKQHFQNVIEDGGKQPMLQRRAKYGLAQTLETMNEPEEALPLYEGLAKDNPEDAFGKAATERVAQLKRLNDNQWYAWFDGYKPVAPPADPLRGSGSLDNLPSSNNLKNDLPASGLIDSELDEKIDSPIEFDAPKSKSAPKKDDAFPIDPANNNPDEKKADDPATETPADEKKADAAPAEEKTEDKPAESPAADEKKEEPPAAPAPAEETKP